MVNVSTLFAQPPSSAIFNGGNNDGFDKTTFTQAANNIFTGGNGDGWDKTSFAQSVNNIFNGGTGDGWDKTNFVQSVNNIFNGGIGDGWDKTNFVQSVNNIFNGGIGDGWDKTNFAQAANNIFLGGVGDGWASAYRPLGPLPVTLLYFNARKNTSTSSLLEWKTSQELNSSHFDVERSNDAMHYINIGKVLAAGNSALAVQYTFTDNKPETGLNYYRLKQVDIDGKFVYTPSRVVRFDELNAGHIKYYPNPTNGWVNIIITEQMKKEAIVINISNEIGVMVDQIKINANSNSLISVNLGRFAKAVYFIQVKTVSYSSTERIVLQ